MFQGIYNILVSFLGESKQGYYSDDTVQYQFNCPYCADDKGGVDGKYNLEVNFQLNKFHCWSCTNSGNLSKLIKRYGGEALTREYFAAIAELRERKYLDLGAFSDEMLLSPDIAVRLPGTFKKIDLTKCNRRLREYLESRKITQDLIDFYDIGYTSWDNEVPKYRNRIIVPSYDSYGNLTYWSGRDYTGKAFSKYWNSDKDVNAPKKSDVVFNDGKIQFDSDVVLVEGTFDSIYYHNAIPLLGKILTKDMKLYETLKQKANANIIICLDGDTEIEETKQIYRLLNDGRLWGKIWYVDLKNDSHFKDFGEIYEAEGKMGIINTLRGRKQFSGADLNFKEV